MEKDKMAEVEKTASAFGDLIPQAFFDLIARIIPGPIITVSLIIALNLKIDPEQISQYINKFSISTLTLFFSSFFLFYVLSVVFYGIWYKSMNLITILLKQENTFWRIIAFPFNKDPRCYCEVSDVGPRFSLTQDYIKLVNSAAGNRMTKLKAEIHMSGSLVVNFIICAAFSLKFNRFEQAVVFLVFAGGAYFSNQHYNLRYSRSVESYAALLKFDYAANEESFKHYRNWRKEPMPIEDDKK